MAKPQPRSRPAPAPAEPVPAAAAANLGIDPTLFSPEDTAGYYEGMDSGAYAIPFLGILQALSPAVQRGTPEFIDGASPGMILNTVTRRLSERVVVTVLRRSHTLCRWVPRENGGGFLGEEEANVESMAEFVRIVPDEKKRRIVKIDGSPIEITEHRNFWCAVLAEDGRQEPALVSMAKSQLKVARDWNTNIDVESAKIHITVTDGAGQQVRAQRPVLHSGIWELGTQLRVKGENKWYAWTVRFLGLHTDRAALIGIRDKVALARSQSNIARQLEHLTEPTEEDGAGEM